VASLFHYTDRLGHDGILASLSLLPSTVARNPNDVRYGDGQYLSDIEPGTMTLGQLSRALIGHPFLGRRFTHFVEIEIDGLTVIEGRPHVFVIPNIHPLNLTGRIVRSGGN
jgi:hypothetical protein